MNSFVASKSTFTSLVVIASALLMTPIGCGSSETKSTQSKKATGGGTAKSTSGGAATSVGGSAADESGGTSGDLLGGTSAIESVSGGTSALGGGGESAAGASNAAAAGSSSTKPALPEIACTSDVNCKSANLLCDKTLQKCVECLQTSDCKNGVACILGTCGGAGLCQSNADCANSADGKVCDTARNQCVACLTASDCPNPATSDCVAQACVPVETCGDSRDCKSTTAPVCNKTTSRCVQCNDAADCSASGLANTTCVANRCQASCASKTDCTGNKVCNTSVAPGYCVDCVTSADCGQGKACSAGSCAVCAGKTAKPCVQIPQFVGTQVVDGKGDDFCTVPAFELGFDNAAKVIQASGETAAANSYPERATIKVAWSATALHVYIEVVDAAVLPNTNPADIWNGDAVEVMISTNQDLKGLTSIDKNTIHIIGNSVIGVTVSANGESGTHTQIGDPNIFKPATTAQGYAIEVQMPWPAGAKMAAGTPIYFDAALNSARKAADGSAPRNAQALLYVLSPLPTSTSCTGTGDNIAPFCDDRLWCKTKT